MIRIYTRTDLKDNYMNVVLDVETKFNSLEAPFNEKIYNQIMRKIDNIQYRKGNFIKNSFGETSMIKLSTGCKAAMLCAYFANTPKIISVNECGENSLQVIFAMGNKADINIFSNIVIRVCNPNIKCIIGGEEVVGGYNLYNKMLEKVGT